MLARVRNGLKLTTAALALILATVFVVRAIDAWRSPPIELWHREVPHELGVRAIDAADWAAWMRAEDAVFAEVRSRVTDKLPPPDRVAANRYFAGSPMNAAHLARDWNRSQVAMPAGAPRGAVVLLHGLTDSPYSLRHVAEIYRARGFVAVTIRMPGHGTVPAGLTQVEWLDWMAATRLAVRHARGLAGERAPLHLVGYSNGGALALKYALDAVEDPSLARPGRLVLISPMIGITSVARFAGVLGWPAVFPPFAKAAWLDILPEYNPVKYASFPVNAARQSSLLTRDLQAQLARLAANGRIANLAPVLTFQSALDYTVDVRALSALYAKLPANGSELVLFDRNHQAQAAALVKPAAGVAVGTLLPPAPRRFRVTVLTNDAAGGPMREVTTAPDQALDVSRELALVYPPDVYSLSHVALPFPTTDGLYGTQPDASEDFGVRLGTVAVRGERSVLIVSPDALMRMTSNPFFPYLRERLESTL